VLYRVEVFSPLCWRLHFRGWTPTIEIFPCVEGHVFFVLPPPFETAPRGGAQGLRRVLLNPWDCFLSLLFVLIARGYPLSLLEFPFFERVFAKEI